MRALRKVAPGPGFALQHVPVPEIGPSDVLIRVRAVGLCGTDLHIYGWDHWAERRVKPPLTIGHEFMGDVAAVGTAVTGVRAGDRVSAEGHIACGVCRLCRTGEAHICEHVRIIGVDTDGSFADYIRMPEANVWRLDPAIPDSWAAVFDPLGQRRAHGDVGRRLGESPWRSPASDRSASWRSPSHAPPARRRCSRST